MSDAHADSERPRPDSHDARSSVTDRAGSPPQGGPGEGGPRFGRTATASALAAALLIASLVALL